MTSNDVLKDPREFEIKYVHMKNTIRIYIEIRAFKY